MSNYITLTTQGQFDKLLGVPLPTVSKTRNNMSSYPKFISTNQSESLYFLLKFIQGCGNTKIIYLSRDKKMSLNEYVFYAKQTVWTQIKPVKCRA